MFPQSIGLAASLDKNLAYAVGCAIGTEARSIGIHACFSPVLDLGKEPRWGRVQEAWGKDLMLTSHMGVAYASGLSKNAFCRPWKFTRRSECSAFHWAREPPGPDDSSQATVELVADHTVPKSTLKAAARRVLSTKYDLGLFDDPYISDSVDSAALTAAHVPLTLDAAHRSIVLLENPDNILPIKPAEQNLKIIALVGPFSDILNFGDYSGPWGAYPTANSSTLRQAMAAHLASKSPDVSLVSSWGSNTWLYDGQYNIPGYLSVNGVPGGLRETPNRDWGLYPPLGRGKERRVLHAPAPSFVCGAPSLAPGAASYSSQSHSDRRRDTRHDIRSDAFNSLALPPSPNAYASSTITTGSRPVSLPTSNARPALRTSFGPALRTSAPALPAHFECAPAHFESSPAHFEHMHPHFERPSPALRTPVAPQFEHPSPRTSNSRLLFFDFECAIRARPFERPPAHF
ncbi:glycosyl hydrolase family 3 N terminal domain-containing protein [Mycena albidolilacea]|uniref:Glycosyl hydrolase family 3 N terminal domain-containing protein n=1 Tax=Mycena albidolilacea TaxID=1033008 RepID=A0AAD7ANC0_9AGAR|nr:glycosyl hydrolase family 3 N terminal domain-containing protein [Mycena albidolilacea]